MARVGPGQAIASCRDKLMPVSFDIFLQRFESGEVADGDPEPVLAVITPLVEKQEGDWARIRTEDGTAEIYGLDTAGANLMINRASGRQIWDVILAIARAGSMAVMPVGCGTVVPDKDLVNELPPDIPRPIAVADSADELLNAVEDTAAERPDENGSA